MKHVYVALLSAWFLVLVGCPAPEPATEVEVQVTSDLEYPSEIDGVGLFALDPAGTPETADSTKLSLEALADRNGGKPFPLSFSLSSPNGQAAAFRVAVQGTLKGKVVVLAQARGAFIPRRKTYLQLHLARACANNFCGTSRFPDRTCVDGTCGDVPMMVPDPSVPVDAGLGTDPDPATGDDAGMKRDGGKLDSGGNVDVDGGPSIPPDAGPSNGPACQSAEQCQNLTSGAMPAGCAVAFCVEGKCEFRTQDADGDDHGVKEECSIPGQTVKPGADCDDNAPELRPGAWDGPAGNGKSNACDQKDNDCDGEVDEEKNGTATCACDPARDKAVNCSERPDGSKITWPMGAPAGNCKFGTKSCNDGAFSACTGAVEPKEKDACTPGDDSNCNGIPNEGCSCTTGEMQRCGATAGDCEAGMQLCQNGSWGPCTGAKGPSGMDTCEPNSDRDCDGMPNEGCECVSGTTAPCGEAIGSEGDCAARMVRCMNGRWRRQDCAPTSQELCNNDGRDENCNGVVNELLRCLCTNGQRFPCLGARGACAEGQITCVNGGFSACSIQPQERDSCNRNGNGGDEDCDGTRGENCCATGSERPCMCGQRAGMQQCGSDNRWRGDCVCPEPPPPPPPDSGAPDPVTLELPELSE